MGVGGQPHAPAVSIPGKDPVPIVQEAGWASGPVWTGGKSRPHRDSIPDRPAHSQSPYFGVPDITLQCSQKAASGPSPVLLTSFCTFCTFSQSWLLALGPVLLYFPTYHKFPLQFSSTESVNCCLSYTRTIIFHNFRKMGVVS